MYLLPCYQTVATIGLLTALPKEPSLFINGLEKPFR
jgi:hypothetical protein